MASSPIDSDPLSFLTALLGPAIVPSIDLGDRGLVELLVRNYLERCGEGVGRAAQGEISQDDLVDQLSAVADALNDVFLGASGLEEVIFHSWNTPEELGVTLVRRLEADCLPDEAVRALFIRLATVFMNQVRDSRAGTVDREQLIKDACDLLVGPAIYH